MKRLLAASLLCATALLGLLAPAASAEFGIKEGSFEVTFKKTNGFPDHGAGTHPHDFTTSFRLNTAPHPTLGELPDESAKDQLFFQIPGLAGNPTAVPTCDAAVFAAGNSGNNCPDAASIGKVDIEAISAGNMLQHVAVYNLVPQPGTAALLGFYIAGIPTYIHAGVNPNPPYNITGLVRNTSQFVPFFGADLELWGNPADPAHDAERGNCKGPFSPGKLCPAGVPNVAYFTVPRACEGPLASSYELRSWQGSTDSGSVLTHDLFDKPAGFSGCAGLGFEPEVSAAPSTNVASSPSGFDFGIEISDPGLLEAGGTADSDLKKAVVTLPEQINVNAAAAGGLEACTGSQLERETYDSLFGAGCPAASRVATVDVSTPLLDEDLSGSIFLAEPYHNPLGTLLAGYLVIKQPQRGIAISLPGKIEANPVTGQITASFDQNPQLPFDDLEVSFFGGAQGPLTTPPACGTYQVRTELHPWSGNAPDVSTQPFTITQAPGGGPCPTSPAQLPHTPAFDAGTVSPLAGHHSPFVVNLRRQDGSQRFSTVRLTPPPGLTAKLAGTPACPDGALAAAASKSGKAEQAAPSCPAASRVGSVFAAAGSGPAPYWAPGTAYLAGPYKGAPLSMAIVTPAVAGPFDLGVVVIRTALHVDPATAQITATSDPIPELLQGIPLDIRVASVRLDKPSFTLNGTSCNPFALSGALTSTLGALAPLHSRFQLGECGRLGFKPRLGLRLVGATKRGRNPKLIANLRTRPGDANIGRTQVTLPRSAFLDQSHIRTICTRVQWAADACPKGSVYGRARATTPLLDHPIAGNVYLRSSDNELPDLVADLRGPAHQPIRIELVGRTDSVKGALRNTFDVVPDAPASTFRLELFGGKRGLVVNSRDICARDYRATVRMNGHNGRTATVRPVLRNARCKKQRRAKKRQAKRGSKRGAKRSAVALRDAVRGALR